MSRALKSFADYFRRLDKVLWILLIAISTYGLLLVASATRESTENYFFTQLLATLLGYAGAIVLTLIDYRAIANYWYLVAGFSIFLIIYTLLFGTAATGDAGVNARAWIILPGGVSFQPSELVKIGFMVTFSKHLSAVKSRGLITHPLHVVLLGCHALIPAALVHFQGDDGAAVIFFCMFLAMSFAAGVQLRYFIGLIGAGLIAAPLAWQFVLEDYQKRRIINMMNPEADPLGDGLQQLQGKISIGSGRLWGQGLFQGPRVENNRVPLQHSDFIFSVAGEELGFIGCMLIIVLLFLLLLRLLYIARRSADDIGTYLCFGFFALIASQAIFNIGMCLSLLPVIGVTLPFFSAGGSSAACLYLGFGLVENVYMHRFEGDKVHVQL